MTKTAYLLGIACLLASCEKTNYVWTNFMIDNQTDKDLRCYVSMANCGDCGISTNIQAGQKVSIIHRKGVRGSFMIEYLFSSFDIVYTDTTGTDISVYMGAQFRDPNNWQDYQDSELFRSQGGDMWTDTCTFVVTQDMLDCTEPAW